MPSTHDRAGSQVVMGLGVSLAAQRTELDPSQWTREFLQSAAMPFLAAHASGTRRSGRTSFGKAVDTITSERTSKIVGSLGEVLEMAVLSRLGVSAELYPQGVDVKVFTDRPFALEVKTSIGTRKNSKCKYTAFVTKQQLAEAEEIHMWYLNQDAASPRWDLIATPSEVFAAAAAEFLPKQWLDPAVPKVLAGWMETSASGMASVLLDHKVTDPAAHMSRLVERHR